MVPGIPCYRVSLIYWVISHAVALLKYLWLWLNVQAKISMIFISHTQLSFTE